ncbi:type III toxin-antitoxin system ToxN/AbiQ family toxin [Clostridium perfringens]|uniref:type III toxin-antitoxin system ToxN/AbiQ family toxin n=1 Tax=Clostridium perfringens TaxID=1502 RepID=UPI000DF101DA|nr:type III toxin-antitoxin system ToxN/AbiQ family toxin [Clostridium perfringens]STB67889.1 Uncharacterised protein [Clostridium perfringens]
MRIYRVKEEYIEYLRRFDDTVEENKNEKRPYIGILIQVNEFNYFAPLTSPKPKHKTMKNQIDFIKIKDGELGAINLNLMIPVPLDQLIKFDINKEEEEYRNLLRNQYRFLKSNKNKIKDKADNLYEKVVKYNSFVKERCVKFKLLESKCKDYNEIMQEVASTGIKKLNSFK